MPKKPSITSSDVGRIASEYLRIGIRPTVMRILEAHGSGSFSTINPLLREWREKQADKASPAISAPLMTAIAKEIERACDEATADLRFELENERADQLELVKDIETKELRLAQLETELTALREQRLRDAGTIEQLRVASAEQKDEFRNMLIEHETKLKDAQSALRESEIAKTEYRTRLEMLAANSPKSTYQPSTSIKAGLAPDIGPA